MIAALARFADALRAERHAVSPAELIDASHALDLIGLERRAEVKAALRATLAKDKRAAEAFDRLFDRFFAPPRFPSKAEGAGRVATGGTRPRPSPAQQGPPLKKKKPSQTSRPLSSTLQQLVSRIRHDGERREGRLRRVKLRPAVRDPKDPVRKDLSQRLTTDEERAIAREVPRMISALKLRAARRQSAARRGRPWLRRALRDNVKHGGIPFVIPHRAPKRKSTRVVLLVDVSYSVARASGLFLLMASAFLELGRRARVLAFVDRPVDATAAVARWTRGARHRTPRVSFVHVVDGLRALNPNAPSDYGTAFHALRSPRLRPRGRDTVLVVLGDGRTNRFDPLPWAFAEVARGCKAVLWLAPEPKRRWGTADSALPAYVESVDVLVEATDLAGLASGLYELMRRL